MENRMRILFMGTPEFAVPSLASLIEQGYTISAVISQPDRPKGRKRELTPSPVKAYALEQGITVIQPEKLRSPDGIAQVTAIAPDLIITAAYGQILPKAVLDLPRFGCINVHGSLLPRYRGGAPIQRSIINGEAVTGVTLMYMAEGLDTGDMIAKVEEPITDEDTAGTMFEKLSVAGAKLLMEWLPRIIEGAIERIPQVESDATYAPNLTREDERLDWSQSSRSVFNRVRGLNPMAGGFSYLDGEVFKVWRCRIPQGSDTMMRPDWVTLIPGSILQTGSFGIRIRTGDGSVVLTEVQPAGKKALAATDFARGARLAPGKVLG